MSSVIKLESHIEITTALVEELEEAREALEEMEHLNNNLNESNDILREEKAQLANKVNSAIKELRDKLGVSEGADVLAHIESLIQFRLRTLIALDIGAFNDINTVEEIIAELQTCAPIKPVKPIKPTNAKGE